jgi:hypothetical protein
VELVAAHEVLSPVSWAWQPPAPVVVTGSLVPASRGAACVVRGGGQEAVFAAGECPLTAGTLEEGAGTDALGFEIGEVVIDLGATTALSALTLHGAREDQVGSGNGGWAAMDLTIETADDCEVFAAIVEHEAVQPLSAAPIDAVGEGRCVRVTFERPLESLAEVGVW